MHDPQTTFRALSDPTRRAILSLLSDGPLSVGAVAQKFDMTRPAVAKHLGVLAEGHLIEVIPRGRERLNRLTPGGMAPVINWLATFDAFWDDRLSALKDAIEADIARTDRPPEAATNSEDPPPDPDAPPATKGETP